ncbi:uncharacterized protein LOC143274900 [Babylonia areolata]|uniref:uncharacterized protein LOC143274900 n=1 Tax=Babylonia areolata TaxID=304850 RepID=UPI003FCFFD38
MLLISTILAGGLVIFLGELFPCAAKAIGGSPSSSSAGSAVAQCNDPARERLEELWQSHGTWHDTIFQLDNMATSSVATRLQDIDPDFVDIKQHALQKPTCPFGQGSQAELEAYRNRTGGEIKLCPSHDMINFDENRVPSTLFEKRCSCTGCGFLNEDGRHGHAHSGANTLGCVSVYYYAKVLRRVGCDKQNNVFIYRATLEPLVMGCACEHDARPLKSKIIRSSSHGVGPGGVVATSTTATTTQPPAGKKKRRRRKRIHTPQS